MIHALEIELSNYVFVNHGYVDKCLTPDFPLSAERGATAWQVEAVAMLIMSGRFLGYLPERYGAPLVAEGRLRKIGAAEGYATDVAAIFQRSNRQSPLLQRVISALSCLDSIAQAATARSSI